MKIHEIHQDRELMIDDFLTESRSGLEFRLHEPHPQIPEPSLASGYYMTMIQESGRIRCYYRGNFGEYTGKNSPYTVKPGYINEFVGYKESSGGVRFLTPPLFIHDCGVPNVLWCMETGTHNFTPFADENPECPPEQRYKAIAGVSDQGGIYGFVSPDGIRFKRIRKTPLVKPLKQFGYCFDSQNVAFYSEAEKQYVMYYRVNLTRDKRPLRTFCRATSPDFLHWSGPEELDVNLENEHLYVSLLAPYPRAKQLYVGTPTRYFDDRGSATDITLIFSRAGGPVLRPFPGAWIKPGPDPERWKNRANYLACNVVQTSPEELSFYHALSRVRYTLRTDGFISLSAGVSGGEWTSKVMKYDGGELEFNVATSAGGSFQVELQTPGGKPVPGFSLADSRVFYGDRIAYAPEWNGSGALPMKKGDPFRIRCLLREADFYSFSFQNNQKGVAK